MSALNEVNSLLTPDQMIAAYKLEPMALDGFSVRELFDMYMAAGGKCDYRYGPNVIYDHVPNRRELALMLLDIRESLNRRGLLSTWIHYWWSRGDWNPYADER